MNASHDELRRVQHSHGPRRTGRFHMHGGNAAKGRMDLSEEGTEVELPGEESPRKIARDAGLDIRRIDHGGGEGAASRLDNQVADALAFLPQVALEIGAPSPNDMDRFGHQPKLNDNRRASNSAS